MEERNVSFTVTEANMLLQMIDLAVKNNGLIIAKDAVLLSDKIKVAFEN